MLELLNKEILTESDISKLISLKVEESVHLDFKQAGSLGKNDKKKNELAKDVSSFANSDGGFIIYGIAEKSHVADSLSFIDGNEITKEWIEQVLQTRIQRKIEGLRILPVRFENDITKSIYVIKIPESSLAPHMTSENRFYKRYNFESVQMAEYEIRNLYNRKERTELIFESIISKSKNVEVENTDQYGVVEFHSFGFQVKNIGRVIEKYFKLIITFNFVDYVIKFSPFSDSKPTHFLKTDNNRAISFSNICPIFPEEIMSVADLEFGIPVLKKQEIMETGKLYIELIYTNGTDEFELDVKAMIKK